MGAPKQPTSLGGMVGPGCAAPSTFVAPLSLASPAGRDGRDGGGGHAHFPGVLDFDLLEYDARRFKHPEGLGRRRQEL